MIYDHAWIAARIPHQGSMCLLDHVESWNEERLVCIATSHTSVDNPLRGHGRLGVAAGIEYAAQAMAVHGALLASVLPQSETAARPAAGFLASVRGASMHVARLDDIGAALQIEAVCIHREGNSILYQFTVRAQGSGQPLLDGRAAVIVNAALLTMDKEQTTK